MFTSNSLSHEIIIFCCSIKFQEFRFKRHYECHLDGHKRNNCVCCNMVITHRKQLIQHMLKVHSIKLETAIHKCRHCEKRYVKKKSLYYHMRQHCTNKLVCIDCGTVCSSPEEYSMHLLQHETHKPYKCGKCTERFYRRQQYVSHLKVGYQSLMLDSCLQIIVTLIW